MTAISLQRVGKGALLAAIFVAGNIILPQICHLVPQGGLRWLPIYFFTLIAAYRYGLGVGLATAIASPVINWALFGMPGGGMLPVILGKSTLLAVAASLAGSRFPKASLASVGAVIIAYQECGFFFEWALTGSAAAAASDLSVGLPGLLLQLVAAPLLLRKI